MGRGQTVTRFRFRYMGVNKRASSCRVRSRAVSRGAVLALHISCFLGRTARSLCRNGGVQPPHAGISRVNVRRSRSDGVCRRRSADL